MTVVVILASAILGGMQPPLRKRQLRIGRRPILIPTCIPQRSNPPQRSSRCRRARFFFISPTRQLLPSAPARLPANPLPECRAVQADSTHRALARTLMAVSPRRQWHASRYSRSRVLCRAKWNGCSAYRQYAENIPYGMESVALLSCPLLHHTLERFYQCRYLVS